MAKYKGIDVSTWNTGINWDKVKKDGISFAMIRSSFGRYDSQVDNQFENHYKNAKKVGMPVGAYHYSYAKNVEQAKEEADFFLRTIKGKQFEYPVAFDIEDSSQSGLGRKNITDITLAFCNRVQSAGYYVMIYANLNWLDNKLEYSRIKQFDIWVAQYNSVNQFEHPYGMWQYTSSGRVDGISGNVDLDYAYKDYPSIIKGAGLNGFKKDEVKPEPEEGFKQGDRGDGVLALKSGLRSAKQLGVIETAVNGDDVFDAATTAAVKEVQKKSGLTENGVAGSKTIEGLSKLNTDAIEKLQDKIKNAIQILS